MVNYQNALDFTIEFLTAVAPYVIVLVLSIKIVNITLQFFMGKEKIKL